METTHRTRDRRRSPWVTASKLQEIRQSSGRSQLDVALLLSRDIKTVSNFEVGRTALAAEYATVLAQAYGVGEEQLFKWSQEAVASFRASLAAAAAELRSALAADNGGEVA